MSYWNQGYNKKKQEELQAKQQVDKSPHRDIYLSNASTWNKAREAQRRDRFAWRVGFFVMAIISIVGIYAIYWAATL